jgi:hypothetical protein
MGLSSEEAKEFGELELRLTPYWAKSIIRRLNSTK